MKASGDVAMGYWDQPDLPFYYSLARTYSLGNRWFASTPCQTYPNRRFLMAATAYGLISTSVPGPNDPPPPNGTIFDRLNHYGASWRNYLTDLPQIAIIPSALKANPSHVSPIAQFYADCRTGALPNVSFVDPDFGLTDVAGGLVPGQPVPTQVRAVGQDEENPQNLQFGEAFVAQVVGAVTSSPAWPRTLLVWCYDEHGGYYDHVPPPPAIAPDTVAPQLKPGDVARRLRHLWGARARRRGVTVSPARLGIWRRPRPDIDPRLHRAEMEPACPHPARCERRESHRLPRSLPASTPGATCARPAGRDGTPARSLPATGLSGPWAAIGATALAGAAVASRAAKAR